MRIWTRKSASIQPRTSPLKLEGSEQECGGSYKKYGGRTSGSMQPRTICPKPEENTLRSSVIWSTVFSFWSHSSDLVFGCLLFGQAVLVFSGVPLANVRAFKKKKFLFKTRQDIATSSAWAAARVPPCLSLTFNVLKERLPSRPVLSRALG